VSVALVSMSTALGYKYLTYQPGQLSVSGNLLVEWNELRAAHILIWSLSALLIVTDHVNIAIGLLAMDILISSIAAIMRHS